MKSRRAGVATTALLALLQGGLAVAQDVPVSVLSDAPPLLADVKTSFMRIPALGAPLAAWFGDEIQRPSYTARVDNRLGFKNHFQSIQRVPGSNYLVVSGSDPNGPMSSLFVIRLASRSGDSAFGSNLPGAGPPPRGDAVVTRVDVDATLWHAGGLATYGRVLVVPVYGGNPLAGRVLFYDMADPGHPVRMPVQIERPGRKAYAVAVMRLPNGHYLVAVLSDRDELARRLDLYLSRTEDLADGFGAEAVTWFADAVTARNGQDANFGDFQNISFVQQTDGRIFLVGLHNTAPSMDILPGRDYADLYEMEFPDSLAQLATPTLRVPVVTKIANRHLVCRDGHCNFDAAAGLYVDRDGSLAIYAATFWLDGSTLKLTEFAPDSGEE